MHNTTKWDTHPQTHTHTHLRFKISMDNLVLVKMADYSHKLPHDPTSFCLGE